MNFPTVDCIYILWPEELSSNSTKYFHFSFQDYISISFPIQLWEKKLEILFYLHICTTYHFLWRSTEWSVSKSRRPSVTQSRRNKKSVLLHSSKVFKSWIISFPFLIVWVKKIIALHDFAMSRLKATTRSFFTKYHCWYLSLTGSHWPTLIND